MTAMDMRMFDSAIARWVVQDPVVHHFQSPYNGFDGNPVYWADPSGADADNSTNRFDYDGLGRARYDEHGWYIDPTRRGQARPDVLEMLAAIDRVSGGGSGISTLEYALLAQDVYGETSENLNGWEDAGNPFGLTLSDDLSGLLAKFYSKEIDGVTQYALVYAGTQDIGKDGIQNVLQAFGTSEQYQFAVLNAKKLSERGVKNVTFIGYSLGGGLASASALAFGGRAVTFNPAWLSNSSRITYNLYNKNVKITNYIVRGEILDLAQKTFGRKYGLEPSGSDVYKNSLVPLRPYVGPIQAHTIGVVIESIKGTFKF